MDKDREESAIHNKPDAVMVYTGETLEELVSRGWTGNWVAGLQRVRSLKLLVVVRSNGRTTKRNGHLARSAFLLAHISDVKAASEVGRIRISFDRFAEIFVSGAWTGSRNPVAYVRLKTLGIDVGAQDWRAPAVPLVTASS